LDLSWNLNCVNCHNDFLSWISIRGSVVRILSVTKRSGEEVGTPAPLSGHPKFETLLGDRLYLH